MVLELYDQSNQLSQSCDCMEAYQLALSRLPLRVGIVKLAAAVEANAVQAVLARVAAAVKPVAIEVEKVGRMAAIAADWAVLSATARLFSVDVAATTAVDTEAKTESWVVRWARMVERSAAALTRPVLAAMSTATYWLVTVVVAAWRAVVSPLTWAASDAMVVLTTGLKAVMADWAVESRLLRPVARADCWALVATVAVSAAATTALAAAWMLPLAAEVAAVTEAVLVL